MAGLFGGYKTREEQIQAGIRGEKKSPAKKKAAPKKKASPKKDKKCPVWIRPEDCKSR